MNNDEQPASTPPLTSSPTQERRSALHHNRDYLAWFLADTSSQLGRSIQAFAMLLIGYAVTGSVVQAGLVSTVSTVASLVLTLPGGVLVDRWDRRLSLTVSGLARATIFGAAAAAWWCAGLSASLLYAVAAVSGALTGLFSTASDAALKSVVPTEELTRAVSANQGRDAAINLLGAPVSGLLINISYGLPLLAGALCPLLQAVATRLIRADLRPRPEQSQDPGTGSDPSPSGRVSVIADLLDGFAVFRQIEVLPRIVAALVLVNTGIQALMVGITLTLQSSGTPAWQIGLLDGAVGVGMLAGATFAGPLVTRAPSGRLIITGFLFIAVFLVPLAFAQDVPVMLGLLAVVGLALPVVNGALGGYMQAQIPDALQGRALSAIGLVISCAPALMPAAVGVGLTQLGSATTLALTCVLFPAAAGVLASSRSIRELPRPDRWVAAVSRTVVPPQAGDAYDEARRVH